MDSKSSEAGVVNFYKKDKKVVLRKPKRDKDFVTFTSSVDIPVPDVKNFLKYVVCDVQYVNYHKNEFAALVSEYFRKLNKNPSSNPSISLMASTIFYIWVYLPFDYSKSTFATPEEIKREIFAFDLLLVRQRMTKTDIRNIVDTAKRMLDIHVHVRKYNETTEIPFQVIGNQN